MSLLFMILIFSNNLFRNDGVVCIKNIHMQSGNWQGVNDVIIYIIWIFNKDFMLGDQEIFS